MATNSTPSGQIFAKKMLQTVLPLLGRVPGAACTSTELSDRLLRWFDELPEPATVVFDFQSDCDLLLRALAQQVGDSAPKNLKNKLLISPNIECALIFAETYHQAWNSELPEHHALGDARALRSSYLAYRSGEMRISQGFQEPGQSGKTR